MVGCIHTSVTHYVTAKTIIATLHSTGSGPTLRREPRYDLQLDARRTAKDDPGAPTREQGGRELIDTNSLEELISKGKTGRDASREGLSKPPR
jgi:hypothetical protein